MYLSMDSWHSLAVRTYVNGSYWAPLGQKSVVTCHWGFWVPLAVLFVLGSAELPTSETSMNGPGLSFGAQANYNTEASQLPARPRDLTAIMAKEARRPCCSFEVALVHVARQILTGYRQVMFSCFAPLMPYVGYQRPADSPLADPGTWRHRYVHHLAVELGCLTCR